VGDHGRSPALPFLVGVAPGARAARSAGSRSLRRSLASNAAHCLWSGIASREHAARIAERLLAVAEEEGNPERLLQAHHAAWATLVFEGDLAGSQQHVRQGLAIYDREKHGRHALLYGGHDPAVCGTGQGGIAYWALGFPDQAAQSARQSIAFANALEHPPSLGHALWFIGVTHLLRREPGIVFDAAERLIALSRERGLAQYQAIGAILHGWAGTFSGQPEAGLIELRAPIEGGLRAAAAVVELFSVGRIASAMSEIVIEASVRR